MTIWQFAIARAAAQLAYRINAGEELTPDELSHARQALTEITTREDFATAPAAARENIITALASDQLQRLDQTTAAPAAAHFIYRGLQLCRRPQPTAQENSEPCPEILLTRF
jgi:hypothetical protein